MLDRNEQTLGILPGSKAIRPVDRQYSHFSPEDYFVGIVLRAIATRKGVHVSLPGQGEIFVWPQREMYAANIKTERFWRVCADQFEVTSIREDATLIAGTPLRPLNELLWQATFHASQGRLIEGCHKFDIVQFKYWPNLTRLPCTANTARICAALVAHPTTIMILRAMLKIDAAEVCQIYSAAHIAGITNILNRKRNEISIATDSQSDVAPESSKIERKLDIFGILAQLRVKLGSY